MTAEPFLPQDQNRLLAGLAIAGAIVLVCGIVFAPLRIWSNLLVATFYLVTIGLGGALFVALTYITGAGGTSRFAAFRRRWRRSAHRGRGFVSRLGVAHARLRMAPPWGRATLARFGSNSSG